MLAGERARCQNRLTFAPPSYRHLVQEYRRRAPGVFAGYVTALAPGFRPSAPVPAATSPTTTVGTTVRKR